MRTEKRSSCASGSGNVPSCSIGFSVAMTKNGGGSSWVRPSTVTCRSAIASSSADCVFGIDRLISSTSTMFANTGPGRNSNSRERGSNTESPVTSVGCRSGVHWIRENVPPPIEPAIERARIVFAVPGTSSSRTCEPATRAARMSLTSSSLPSTTCSTFRTSRSATPCALSLMSSDPIARSPRRLCRGDRERASQVILSVPFMPAAAWPGTVQ